MPQDPASGAARTPKTICEFLASSGEFTVQTLATTASEKGGDFDAVQHLHTLGIQVTKHKLPDSLAPELWRFVDNGVTYSLMNSRHARNTEWESDEGVHFDRYFEQLLNEFEPDLIFTHGGHARMISRWARARKERNLKVVFGLWNHGYFHAQAMFAHVDAVLTPSQFLTDRYHGEIGLQSTPLPSPMKVEDVVSSEREPVFFTIVNPSIEKGLMFTARFADELSKHRPDIPLMIIEARGTAGTLTAAGLAGGFDLRQHENIMVSPGVPKPRDYFAVTRALLVPSVWEEPSGRVASEALVNGVPPIVSDRGGLPEECRGAGIVLPLPDDLTTQTRFPVEVEAVQPWIDAVAKLADDEEHYQQESLRAKAAGEVYLPAQLQPRYCEFFRNVLTSGSKQT